ncbi:hypothetical protein BpHYR1_008352 [Brachionus plicatilis]|uniref:Uncharacterized protein n=1 Tax=Brachionus plicatilis TaxID=10195 RepID=A0A3M7PZ43_BRAPC|nr:hypothetical protein BpHYR1_008352 [Brachionus plicatilis]
MSSEDQITLRLETLENSIIAVEEAIDASNKASNSQKKAAEACRLLHPMSNVSFQLRSISEHWSAPRKLQSSITLLYILTVRRSSSKYALGEKKVKHYHYNVRRGGRVGGRPQLRIPRTETG